MNWKLSVITEVSFSAVERTLMMPRHRPAREKQTRARAEDSESFHVHGKRDEIGIVTFAELRERDGKQTVSGIEVEDVFSPRRRHAFVHGGIDAVVGLANPVVDEIAMSS